MEKKKLIEENMNKNLMERKLVIINHNIINDYNYGPGTIIDELRYFDFNKPISKQDRLDLCDDLFMVLYPHSIYLEVDWKPSIDMKRGKFVIVLVQRYKRKNTYVFYKVTRRKNELVKYIFEAHDLAKELLLKIKNKKLDFKEYGISDEARKQIFYSIPKTSQ